MSTLEQSLEAILFYIGEPISRARLARILEVPEEEVSGAARQLATNLSNRGINLLFVGDQYELITASETSEIVTKIRKDELTRDLGKAGAETLAIILYHGPSTRSAIEYVRGVNCSFVLRNLLIRGLVERIPHPNNPRSIQYQATPDLLKSLGVRSVEELPDYEAVKKELRAFEEVKDTIHETSVTTDTT